MRLPSRCDVALQETRNRAAGRGLADELAAIGDETPLRLSIVLADPGQIGAARHALAARLGTAVDIQAQQGAVIDVATACSALRRVQYTRGGGAPGRRRRPAMRAERSG